MFARRIFGGCCGQLRWCAAIGLNREAIVIDVGTNAWQMPAEARLSTGWRCCYPRLWKLRVRSHGTRWGWPLSHRHVLTKYLESCKLAIIHDIFYLSDN